MKDTQNVTIGLLLATAVILGALLLNSYWTSDQTAYAQASVKQNDYILGTAARSTVASQVFVVDIAARQMNVYDTNINTWTMDMTESVDLDRAFRQ